MDLKIKDVSRLLNITEKTVLKWIKEKDMPFYKINHQYRFNKGELNEWILKNNIPISDNFLEISELKEKFFISNLVKKGKIFYNIEGKDVNDVIASAINVIDIPIDISKNEVIQSLIEREEMMTTGIGEGIAIPHPRNPIITDIEHESISICMLKNEVDFKSIDDKLVHTLLIILSANPRRHLEILSKISFLCRQSEFIKLLKNHSTEETILTYIEEKEQQWESK